MNDLKLKMEDLYVNGVGPLITGFGTLPNVLQTAIIGVGVMAVASQFLGGVFPRRTSRFIEKCRMGNEKKRGV